MAGGERLGGLSVQGGEDGGALLGAIGLGRQGCFGGDSSAAFAQFIAAEHQRAGGGAQPRCQGARQGGFAGALQPANGHQPGRRRVEIGLGRGQQGFGVITAARCDMGADEGAHGQPQRQSPQQSHIAAAGDVAVHHPIGGGAAPALVEVHQQEGEVIAGVDTGQILGKFQRVEGRGPALDQAEIAQMQIAMAAALEGAARGQPGGERLQPRGGGPAPGLHRPRRQAGAEAGLAIALQHPARVAGCAWGRGLV